MKKKITFQRSFGKGCANSAILSCVHVPASAPAFKVSHAHDQTQNKPAKSTSQADEKHKPSSRKAAAGQKRKRPHPCDLIS